MAPLIPRFDMFKIIDMPQLLFISETELKKLKDENEKLRVQLAGVSVAAKGGTYGSQVANHGEYGWSPEYQEVLELRRSYDLMRIKQYELERQKHEAYFKGYNDCMNLQVTPPLILGSGTYTAPSTKTEESKTASKEPRTVSEAFGMKLTTNEAAPEPIVEVDILHKIIRYFTKRSKENLTRAEKLDEKCDTKFLPYEEFIRTRHSAYYFSGKADSYKRAAEKVEEMLHDVKK